jgi:hypothetical protein
LELKLCCVLWFVCIFSLRFGLLLLRSSLLFSSSRSLLILYRLWCTRLPTTAAAMSSIGTGYDLSVTTFSPDGRVFQIEYATKAVDNSGTVVGIKCKDGVVLGVEKLIPSKMLLEGSNRRIHAVHKHAGMAVAGLAADGRQIVARARSEASQYLSFYGEDIPIKELCDRVAHYVHLCTLYWWLRPFGSATILGGYDRDGPQLYMIEPSGVAYVCTFSLSDFDSATLISF